MRNIDIKPRKLYVIIFVAAFCMGFLVRHLVAVREKNIELSERAENRKFMDQVVKKAREDLDKDLDDFH